VLLGNVLILAGALCNAAAGTLARASGLSSSFWLVMALGWIVFYLGVLLTGKRRSVVPAVQARDAEESAASV
jgi:drug/metabolite transporter (DMT)-like permease